MIEKQGTRVFPCRHSAVIELACKTRHIRLTGELTANLSIRNNACLLFGGRYFDKISAVLRNTNIFVTNASYAYQRGPIVNVSGIFYLPHLLLHFLSQYLLRMPQVVYFSLLGPQMSAESLHKYRVSLG